jgi:phosphoadenosine phosphosulfate reductase
MINELRDSLRGKNAHEIIARAIDRFGYEKILVATSFSIEDQAITHMAWSHNPKARIFTLDTGRLFQETYNVMQQTMEGYKITIEECVPDAVAVALMVEENGPNLFYKSLENRKKCCDTRKVAPLRNKLGSADAWITGQRRGQSVTRMDLEAVEWDAQFGIFKINPLALWSEEQTWDYLKLNNVPYNRLYDAGFSSIGCEPCTRAIGRYDDVRSGRWWWEPAEHKECGLHPRTDSIKSTGKN